MVPLCLGYLKRNGIMLPLCSGFIPNKVLIFILFFIYVKNIQHHLPFRKKSFKQKYLEDLTNKNKKRKLIFYMLWL